MTKKEIAVITAVTGRYDHIGRQEMIDECDYIFFTDDVTAPFPNDWVRYYLPDIGRDDRRRSKLPKLNPHAFPVLETYEYVVWIDGDMQIVNPNFPREIIEYMENGFVLSPHFDGRDCAYGEATIRPLKYENEPLDEQVEAYEKDGFPHNYGLYECGVLARRMKTPGLKELGELWHEQNLKWSYQDQVSLPYCLWKQQFTPDVLPQTFRNMNWVHINAHKRED